MDHNAHVRFSLDIQTILKNDQDILISVISERSGFLSELAEAPSNKHVLVGGFEHDFYVFIYWEY